MEYASFTDSGKEFADMAASWIPKSRRGLFLRRMRVAEDHRFTDDGGFTETGVSRRRWVPKTVGSRIQRQNNEFTDPETNKRSLTKTVPLCKSSGSTDFGRWVCAKTWVHELIGRDPRFPKTVGSQILRQSKDYSQRWLHHRSFDDDGFRFKFVHFCCIRRRWVPILGGLDAGNFAFLKRPTNRDPNREKTMHRIGSWLFARLNKSTRP